jgi:hypothetical protein
MSEQKHPVHVAVQNEADQTSDKCTLYVSESNPIDDHTFENLPAGTYTITYTPPEGFAMESPYPTQQTLDGDINTLRVGVQLKEFDSREGSAAGEASSAGSTASVNPLLLLVGLAAVSLAVLGTFRLPLDFFTRSSTANTVQPQQTTTLQSNKTNPRSPSEPTFISQLDSQLRACLTANIRDLSGIPTLAGLVKDITLVKVTDAQVRAEVTLLYKQVDRLRRILQGCDPKLAREILAASDREEVSTLSDSTYGGSENTSQSFSFATLSTCDGSDRNAYFRSNPTLAKEAILGEIEQGKKIYLTGRVYKADGVVWREVIASSSIVDPRQQIMPNRSGWIANCFVRELKR